MGLDLQKFYLISGCILVIILVSILAVKTESEAVSSELIFANNISRNAIDQTIPKRAAETFLYQKNSLVRRPPIPDLMAPSKESVEEEEKAEDPLESDSEEVQESQIAEPENREDTAVEEVEQPEAVEPSEEQLQKQFKQLQSKVETLETQVEQLTVELGSLKERLDSGETNLTVEKSFREQPLIDPNRADVEELKSIDEVSELLARRIIWYRDEVSAFSGPDDLRRVPGMSVKIFEQIKNNFKAGPY